MSLAGRTIVRVPGAAEVLASVGATLVTKDRAGFTLAGSTLARLAAGLDLDTAANVSRDEGRAVVIGTGDAGVLAARWFSPVVPTTIHGHGSWGVATVVRGTVRVERWRPVDASRARLVSVDEARSGAATWFGDPPDDVHRQIALGEGALEVVLLPSDPGDAPTYGPAHDATATTASLLSVYDWAQLTQRYRPEAVLDLNVPYWRLQLQGPAAAREFAAQQIASLAGLRVTECRASYGDDGVVVEVATRFDTDGEERRWREVHLVRVVDDAIARHTVYCTGIWDAATIARQTLEAPMVTP